METGRVEGVCDAADRIDKPDVFDAHGEVIGQDKFGAGEAVFGRKNFDADERLVRRHLLPWSVCSQDGYIADAHLHFRYADTLLCEWMNLPAGATDPEPAAYGCLKCGMLVLAQVSLRDLAVHKVDVGLVAGAEILFDGEQCRGCRHGGASYGAIMLQRW